jgi:hypothetical protein
MKCLILSDNTVSLPVKDICDLLNSSCKNLKFTPGSSRLRFGSTMISFPNSYDSLSTEVKKECSGYELALLFTNIKYDNNFYFDSTTNIVIISFSGWNIITDLPMTNGVIYFIASIFCDELSIGETHQVNTGCINDFWWDKKGVDVGMRAAFLCSNCREKFAGDKLILDDIEVILDLVSRASRKGEDIISLLPYCKIDGSALNVFLCHNSADKTEIREINQIFKSNGLKTWFDEEQIEPGAFWQVELEKQIGNIKNVCVFVGNSGRGPWQDMEIRTFLSEFVSRRCRVIPVIMKSATVVPELPIFLRQMMWVDLRKEFDKNVNRLIDTLKKIV